MGMERSRFKNANSFFRVLRSQNNYGARYLRI